MLARNRGQATRANLCLGICLRWLYLGARDCMSKFSSCRSPELQLSTKTSNVPASHNVPCGCSARRKYSAVNVFQSDAPFMGPSSEFGTDKLWAVVTADRLRLPAPFNDLIHRTHHTFSRERQINFHTQGFTVEVVNQIENPKTASIG